ncbi:MAG: efflux RND transporter periplasmic adaptor subunit [Porticoccaceae bacterium]|nr:MAG: efflux RND transporter periplasmic adaptor subunit [Porticoccaceae bacterium]
MIRRYLLPLLALIGLAIGVATVVHDNRPMPVVQPATQPARAPFASQVAGAGIIEAGSGNIAVGTPVAGLVAAIYVRQGDQVNVGDPLFRIDDRDLQAELLPAAARVKEAGAQLEQARQQLDLAESVPDQRAVSVEEMNNRRAAVAVGAAALAVAQARVEQLKLELERRTVRAPVAGQILRIETRLGEFAQSGSPAPPLMLLGDANRLTVRVDVDENEAWRIRPGAPAEVFMRGNPQLHAPLQFERIDPYVIPKTALTGASAERVDTRVLQVLYSFDRAALPAYVGQQVDVFIEAPSIEPAAAP